MKQRLSISLIYSLILTFIWGGGYQLYFSFSKISGATAQIFRALYSFGHAFEFGLIALLLILIFSVFPNILHMFLALLIGSLTTIFFLADYIVYSQFRMHISVSTLEMFFGPASSDIFVFPLSMYIQAIAMIIGIILAMIFFYFLASYLAKRKFTKLSLIFLALFMISTLVYHGIHAWANFTVYTPITKQVVLLPVSFPLSLNSKLMKMGYKAPEQMEKFEADLMNYPHVFPLIDDNKNTPNIVIIMIDGWRYDMLDSDVTPNIYEFAKLSSVFNKHNSNSNHTRHGVFSLFYSLPGTYWDAAVGDTIGPVLMDILIDRYELGIFASASLASPEFYKTVFANVKNLRLKIDEYDSPSARDNFITDEFINFLGTRNKSHPFFSFVFYDSTHAYSFDDKIYPPKFQPYQAKNYLSLPKGDQRTMVFNNYKNSVGYTDLLAGKVLNSLKNNNLLDNTIVIITGDHGEDFDDLGQGYWGHNGNYTKYQTRVPMIVYWKGMPVKTYEHQTNHFDIAPTLISRVFKSTTDKKEYSSGSDLFDNTTRKFIYMHGNEEYGILTDDIVTIFRRLGPIETVDLDNNLTDKKADKSTMLEVFNELKRFKK